jgi:hypothetical protein
LSELPHWFIWGRIVIEERATELESAVLAEFFLHAIACQRDRQAARTAEFPPLFHASPPDAEAATRAVGNDD